MAKKALNNEDRKLALDIAVRELSPIKDDNAIHGHLKVIMDRLGVLALLLVETRTNKGLIEAGLCESRCFVAIGQGSSQERGYMLRNSPNPLNTHDLVDFADIDKTIQGGCGYSDSEQLYKSFRLTLKGTLPVEAKAKVKAARENVRQIVGFWNTSALMASVSNSCINVSLPAPLGDLLKPRPLISLPLDDFSGLFTDNHGGRQMLYPEYLSAVFALHREPKATVRAVMKAAADLEIVVCDFMEKANEHAAVFVGMATALNAMRTIASFERALPALHKLWMAETQKLEAQGKAIVPYDERVAKAQALWSSLKKAARREMKALLQVSVAHVLAQGVPSINRNGSCQYTAKKRTGDLHCAAWPFIKEFNEKMEGRNWLVLSDMCPDALDRLALKHAHFVRYVLQTAHDNASAVERKPESDYSQRFLLEYYEELVELLGRYGLPKSWADVANPSRVKKAA